MKNIMIKMIKFYQKNLSHSIFKKSTCKFYPSCSSYMIDAINKYGCMKGFFKGIKRILKCNPFSQGGYDPVI